MPKPPELTRTAGGDRRILASFPTGRYHFSIRPGASDLLDELGYGAGEILPWDLFEALAIVGDVWLPDGDDDFVDDLARPSDPKTLTRAEAGPLAAHLETQRVSQSRYERLAGLLDRSALGSELDPSALERTSTFVAETRHLLEDDSGAEDDGVEGDTTDERDGETDGTPEQTADDAAGSAGPSTPTYPRTMTERDQWLLWKPTGDGRKVPRAPWETGDPERFVSGVDPGYWTTFEDAREWCRKLPGDFGLAYSLTREDDIVFVDLDDVVTDGALSPPAARLVGQASSYAAYSTSGTGVHVFLRGALAEGVKSLTGPLDESDPAAGSLEVYDRNRFVAMTGDHIADTPTAVAEGETLIETLEAEYATVSERTPDGAVVEPERDPEELRDIEVTDDIQDVFDAIAATRPSDIRMRSTRTREHGDGTYSYDPSWVHSESGTRLGVLDDVWIYREGMIALDALQLVALEEGLIGDERAYPEGETFWEAVETLRDRGAHVPRYEPASTPLDAAAVDRADEDDDTADRWEVARRLNYGNEVRVHIHPSDRDYQESLALELAPTVIEAASALDLPPAIAYRTAELYAAAHATGLVAGASHEATVGAALRIAATEAGRPRPLAAIADHFDESVATVRNKFHRLLQETALLDDRDPSAFIVDPVDYVPYVASQLGYPANGSLATTVEERVAGRSPGDGSSPVSEVAAAFYATARETPDVDLNQEAVADAVGLTAVTIRNNYPKYLTES